MKNLSQSRAWRYVATMAQRDGTGLCFQVSVLRNITDATRDAMGRRLKDLARGRARRRRCSVEHYLSNNWVWPLTPAGYAKRVVWAIRQSELSKKGPKP